MRRLFAAVAALAVFIAMMFPLDAYAADRAEPQRCVGWAIPGAVGGLALGFGAVAGGYAVAGRSIGNSAGDIALVLTGESVGMTLGPMASCAAFDDEPYVFPAASFAIGGGLIGGTAVGVPLMLALMALDRDSPPRDYVPLYIPMTFFAGTAIGVIAGGWAGLALEDWLRTPVDASVSITPVGDGLGLSVVGSF